MKILSKIAAASPSGTIDDLRWAQLVARDKKADGSFYYSVSTTGIYCRSSCPAKLAKPENVRFHTTCEEAEEAGFRPCKRCRPRDHSVLDQYASIVAQACRMIEASEERLPLQKLADKAGLSAFHFHRLFKRITGLTPRSYATAWRNQRLRKELTEAGTVTEAIYNTGYTSSSRFYEASKDIIGMLPTAYRKGGLNMEIRFAVGECILGAILVAQSERGICAILMGDDAEGLVKDLQDRFPNARLVGGIADFEQHVARVVGMVQAPAIPLDMPLDLQGTAFQQRVWQALQKIPPGETVSYTELARRIGAPKAVRAVAVASACAANPLAIAIPCHRVVRTNGSLSGYRWGIARKRILLEIESGQQSEKRKTN